MLDSLPIWLLVLIWTAIVLISVEVGYRLGDAVHRRSQDEKESPVGVISGTILALLAFILAFTFGMVSDRFDARKALVRDHANAIGTTYLRADFLEEPDQKAVKELFLELVDLQLEAAALHNIEETAPLIVRSNEINNEIWAYAVANGERDMNSDIGALFVESLNESIDVLANRISISVYARVPTAIWIMLGLLVIFAMGGIGYQTGIAESKRSWAALMLAFAFMIVITLILLLDRPDNGVLEVPQQPFESLRAQIVEDLAQYQ